MGFVIKQPSRMQECKDNVFFRSWAGWAIVFGRVQKISLEGCPTPDLTPLKVREGVFNVNPY